LKVWFRTFEELVAKKIQYGDLDEVKPLFQRRGRDFPEGEDHSLSQHSTESEA